MPKRGQRIDMVGCRSGKLLVVEFAAAESTTEAKWRCKCDCGSEYVVVGSALRDGRTTSCGCHTIDLIRASRTKHGGCGARRTRRARVEYNSWVSMTQRCYNESCPQFPNYGGRGITVCERWRSSFGDFLADMGPRPSKGHSIDRINNDGNYEPSNCRWATDAMQSRNTRRTIKITYGGETLCLEDWAKRAGVTRGVLRYCIDRSGSAESALASLIF